MIGCSKCGYEAVAILNRCPSCKRWGTFTDRRSAKDGPLKLAQIRTEQIARMPTRDPAIDYILGGGFVRTCIYLLFGESGTGKSTLLLQLSERFRDPLYVTGEESKGAIKLRASELHLDLPQLRVWSTADLNRVLDLDADPDLLVIDSLHTMQLEGAAGVVGSTSHTIEVVQQIIQWTKQSNAVTICIGHINKDGDLSGMESIKHHVDCTIELSYEADRLKLGVIKNRHGPGKRFVLGDMADQGLIFDRPEEQEPINARSHQRK